LLDLAGHFSFPLAVYVHDGLLVFGAPATLAEAFGEYRNIAARFDLLSLSPRIVAEGLRVGQRSDVWVEWDHLDRDGVCQRTSQVRYVLSHPVGSVFPRIEMVDYRVPAFPELATQLPLALPA